MTKITCIGAGSVSFGLSTLITLLQSEKLRGAEIALVDTNAESLDLMSQLALWLNDEWGCRKLISSHSSHKPALPGSDFVISSLETQPREKLWQQDYELTPIWSPPTLWRKWRAGWIRPRGSKHQHCAWHCQRHGSSLS